MRDAVGVLLCLFTQLCSAASMQPDVSYQRVVTNDLPSMPLITVTVSGATNVSCFTIQETLPAALQPLEISGDGFWNPDARAIRWGPYTNLSSVTVSYRVAGVPGDSQIVGFASADGQWTFDPGPTLITIPSSPVDGNLPQPPPPQVAMPVFSPATGSSVPLDVAISCVTTGAVIYFTLDGTLPDLSSMLYAGPIHLNQPGLVRAQAFAAGWTPSAPSVAYYGALQAPPELQITRSVDSNSPATPVITLNVAPGSNVTCFAVEELLPAGLSAVSVTADGTFNSIDGAVRWGPYFGSNTVTLSYQATGSPGSYLVRARWSVDGRSSEESDGLAILLAGAAGGAGVPPPPSQLPAPVLSPALGTNLPVNVAITCSNTQAEIRFTVDGSLPTEDSAPYTTPLVFTSPTTLRARCFLSGFLPSAATVGYYGLATPPPDAQLTRTVDTNSPFAPTVTIVLTPGPSAGCLAVEEQLPSGLSAASVTAGGVFSLIDGIVRWGPFFGSNGVTTLTYQAFGLPGIYPVRARWSVDGKTVSEEQDTVLVLANPAGGFEAPMPPHQTPAPILSPLFSHIPATITMSCADVQAQIRYTLNGSAPSADSTPYTGPLVLAASATLRARAFRNGFLPSETVSGQYPEPELASSLRLTRTVSDDNTTLPGISIFARPHGNVLCYSITESVAAGLTPTNLTSDVSWNPSDRTLKFGPFTDGQSRVLTYALIGAADAYPLAGSASFDGYPTTITGAISLTLSTALSTGMPPVIVEAPQSQAFGAGETAVFDVVAAGTVPLSYQWQVNGMSLVDNARVSGAQSNGLVISNTLPTDVGQYQVVVFNPYGATTSTVAELAVARLSPFTGGGPITVSAPGVAPCCPAYLQVQLGPMSAVQAGAGWRLHGDANFVFASNAPIYIRAITNSGELIEFLALSGWDPPASNNVSVAAGRLTVVSNVFYTVQPPVLIADPVQGLGITGTPNTSYRLDYRSALENGPWLPARTLTLAPGFNLFLPLPFTNGPAAFYRAVWLP